MKTFFWCNSRICKRLTIRDLVHERPAAASGSRSFHSRVQSPVARPSLLTRAISIPQVKSSQIVRKAQSFVLRPACFSLDQSRYLPQQMRRSFVLARPTKCKLWMTCSLLLLTNLFSGRMVHFLVELLGLERTLEEYSMLSCLGRYPGTLLRWL